MTVTNVPTTTTRETRGFAAEVKFHVDRATASAIRDWARFYLRADEHGTGSWGDEYRITSVYFDTVDLDVLQRRGSYARAKYRIRRYGDESFVFLERKLRTSQLLAKRRTRIESNELLTLDPDQVPAGWEGLWFLRRLDARRLMPACQLSYDRTARLLETEFGAARLTVDERLRVAAADTASLTARAMRPIDDERAIVELKYRVALPSLFKQLIEEFSLTPARLSKYRLGQHTLGHGSVVVPPAEPLRPQLACA